MLHTIGAWWPLHKGWGEVRRDATTSRGDGNLSGNHRQGGGHDDEHKTLGKTVAQTGGVAEGHELLLSGRSSYYTCHKDNGILLVKFSQ